MSSSTVLRDLNKLNTFVRVAERRSFTKAAAELRTTPSVVSKRMKELEETLGFSLMNRSTHGVVLTDAGEGLARVCSEFLEKIDGYVIEARNRNAGVFGTLRVQASSDYAAFVVAPIVKRFGERYPALRVHLFAVEDNSEPVEEGFDVIISAKKPQPPGIQGQDLQSVPHVVCASPTYLRKFGRPDDPAALRNHNCIVNMYAGPKEWPFKAGTRAQAIEVKGSLSSNSCGALVQMGLDGCGIIRVPRYAVAQHLHASRLEELLAKSTLSPETMSIYVAKDKRRPAKVSEFVKFVKEAVAGK